MKFKKGISKSTLAGANVNPDGSVIVDVKPFAADVHSIDVALQSKGDPATVLNVLSADNDVYSDEIDLTGYNALDVRLTITGSGSFLLRVHGSPVLGGTYIFRQNVGLAQGTKSFVIPNMPAYAKIEVIRRSGTATATLTAYGTHATGYVRPTFEEFTLAWNNEGAPALQAETSNFDVYNTDWVRSILFVVKSASFDFTPIYRHMLSNGDASGGNTIGSSKTKNAGFQSASLNPGAFVPSPYGMRFSIRNTDASVTTGNITGHLILIGG
jgi:hypothetical protein